MTDQEEDETRKSPPREAENEKSPAKEVGE